MYKVNQDDGNDGTLSIFELFVNHASFYAFLLLKKYQRQKQKILLHLQNSLLDITKDFVRLLLKILLVHIQIICAPLLILQIIL